MKITFLTMGNKDAPSTRIRAIQYVPHLRQRGFNVRVYSPTPRWPLAQKVRFFVRFFRDAITSDVVFLQKRILPPGILPVLQSAGCRVIYDFDDAIYALDLSYRPFSLGQRLRQQIARCDHVIVGNQYLHDYAYRLNRGVTILTSPVAVPSAPPMSAGEERPLSIGWIGTSSNLRNLDLLKEVFTLLQREFPNIQIRVICDREWRQESLGVTNVRWSLDTQDEEIRKFAIGVMPLADTAYTRGKCSYKALQYMAWAIPVVISPVGMNAELVKDGYNGFLANTDCEWKEKLSALIRSPQLRRTVGLQGYHTVRRDYDLKVCAQLLEAILLRVLDRNSLGSGSGGKTSMA